MTKINLLTITREYKNNGQHAEQVFRFTLTGKIEKADNKPFTMGGDCGEYQVKSARATICKGTDIAEHIAKDGATKYAYVTADFKTAYIMTASEYLEFATEFGTTTRESAKNGGAIKTRFSTESKKMRDYLNR